MKKFMVVRGQHKWSINIDCTYSIFGTFKSNSEGSELEQEMINFTINCLITNDNLTTGNGVNTFYKDLSFVGQPSIGTREFVVERDLGGIWYGFINEESIHALFDVA